MLKEKKKRHFIQVCEDVKFAQIWKDDAFWKENQALRKHFPYQPGGNVLIKIQF